MMVDTRIYGYVTDGGAYHPQCLDDANKPSGDEYGADPLFSYSDEDPEGLTCDDCGDYIFEPVDPHVYVSQPRGRDFACYACSADRDSFVHTDEKGDDDE